MTFSKIGRIVSALVASAALGLGMTACGGGTIGYMWVLGSANSTSTAPGQITGFKIDDYTGNLTVTDHSPFSAGGTNPQMLVVKNGGRFLYVLNSGTGEIGTPNTVGYKPPSGSGIVEFSIGSGGLLTYQATFSSQGFHPVYLQFDGTGNYLYVTDKYSPNYCAALPCTNSALTNTDLNGSITAFSVANDTGRLTLVQNTTILNANLPTNVFEVGPNPIMTRNGGGSCLYTLNANSVYPYQVSPANGQLTLPTTGPQLIGPVGGGQATSLTSINTGSGSAAGYTYFTDGGANQIYSYQSSGTGCVLSPIPSSLSANLVPNVIPVNSLTLTNGSNTYLYVLNQAIPSTQPGGSSISAFTVNTNGALQQLSVSDTSNPYATGSGPVCIVEDPTNKFVYTSNHIDSTVTGKQLDATRGFLSDLAHGSSFPVVQNPTCLVVSGNV